MGRRHWGMVIVGLILVVLSGRQLGTAMQGLEAIIIRDADPPLHFVQPRNTLPLSRPLVLVGHGFSGSTVIMRGFALTLAHGGYTVAVWDFDGHGSNPRPMASGALLENAEAVLEQATMLGFGDPERMAILGHSMGSGVALQFGQAHPDTAATIAVSPVAQPVTPELPRNLLLMAGALEPAFLRNAEERMAEGGAPTGDPIGDPAAGTARKLAVIPGVEHLSILFSPAAHAEALDWLDATFGPQPGAREYADRRVVWYGAGLLGFLLVGAGLAPLVAGPRPADAPRRPLWRRLAALIGGALGATLLLWLSSLAGLDLRGLLGVQVGGYLLVWFGLAGLLSLLGLWVRPGLPSWRAVLGGLLAFAVLWLGVGMLGQWVWLPWLLIPRRLVLWLPGALLLLPWFLAAGEMVAGARPFGRAGWWLAHSIVLAGSMFLAMQLNSELGFIILTLPLFPIILALHALAAGPLRGRWPFALSGALFVSWLLLAVFPM